MIQLYVSIIDATKKDIEEFYGKLIDMLEAALRKGGILLMKKNTNL